MAQGIEVRPFTGSPEEWDAFCVPRADGAFALRHAWMTAVKAVYGGRPYYLAAYDSHGAQVGALPLMLRSVLGTGRVLLSAPFADLGGLCADSPEVELVLLEAAGELGRQMGAGYVHFRHLRRVDHEGLLDDTSRVALRLPLPSSAEELWESLSSNMRSKVRRAGKRGLTAEVRGRKALADFYVVYATNSRDLGSPMHARAFFDAVFDAFDESAIIVVVSAGDKVVGAAMAIQTGEVLSVPWPHSLRAWRRDYCNNLLYWAIFEAAVARRCRVVDFGRSPVGTGPYEFKKSWRMEDHQLYYQYLPLRVRPSLEDRRSGRAYRLFSRLWPHVPMPLATLLGPRIMARLPV